MPIRKKPVRLLLNVGESGCQWVPSPTPSSEGSHGRGYLVTLVRRPWYGSLPVTVSKASKCKCCSLVSIPAHTNSTTPPPIPPSTTPTPRDMHRPGGILRLFLLLTVLLLSLPRILARETPTSFCKCICSNNSTIIALNPPSASTSPTANARLHSHLSNREPPHHKLTCADCNRAFCLDYHLPICKNAREEDVFTTCFRTLSAFAIALAHPG